MAPRTPLNPIHLPAKVPNIPIPNPISAASSAASDVSGLVQALTQKSTWIRIAEGIVGIALISIGVMGIIKSSSAAKNASQTAAKAVKYIV